MGRDRLCAQPVRDAHRQLGVLPGRAEVPHADHPVLHQLDAAVAALRSGQLDSIDDLTPTQYQALKGNKNITLYPSVSNAWTAIELNPGAQTKSGQKFGTGNPALLDPRVREAIELAINKHELVSKVWDGLAVAGAGYLPPAYPQW